MQQPISRIILLMVAFLGWTAIVLQFYLIIHNRTESVSETIIRFFSFFTILTNILVAVSATVLLITKPSQDSFFKSTSVLTAMTVYITVVGIVYNVILRPLWDPQGLQKIVDELLHSVIPILFILFWLTGVNKRELTWNIFPWLIYPFIYLVYILIRGVFSGFYPYPFINVNNLGYSEVLLNAGFLLTAFTALSFLFVTVGKVIGKKKRPYGAASN